MNTVHNFRELAAGSFIYALDNAVSDAHCHDIIQRFESHPEQHYQGRIGPKAIAQESIKKSTDLRVSGNPDWHDIDALLQQSLTQGLGLLSGLHPFFRSNPLHDIGYNIQRTKAGEYYHWHVDSGPGDFSKRQLVAIWYLNSSEQGGGQTQFMLQNVAVTPQRGMLILFPPFWTHIHRGTIVSSGTKYIATTWVCIE